MKAVVAAFNQEKALVGAFSVITNLRMELFEALVSNLRPAGVVVEVEPLLQQRDLVVGVEADAQPRLALLPHPEEVLIQTPA